MDYGLWDMGYVIKPYTLHPKPSSFADDINQFFRDEDDPFNSFSFC